MKCGGLCFVAQVSIHMHCELLGMHVTYFDSGVPFLATVHKRVGCVCVCVCDREIETETHGCPSILSHGILAFLETRFPWILSINTLPMRVNS